MPCNEDIPRDDHKGLEEHKQRAKLGRIACLSRLSITDTEQEVEKLRGVLDHIAANEDREIRVFSYQKTPISSRQATHFRAYGEFVCTAQGNPAKGKSEVLRLRHGTDLDSITAHLKKAFHLVGGARIVLPKDRLCGEMEQLVLSNTHFQNLLDDFVHRLPTRRVLKVTQGFCAPSPEAA